MKAKSHDTRPIRLTFWKTLGVILLVALLSLAVVRVIGGQPLGIRSYAETQIWRATSLVKAIAGANDVKSQSTGKFTNIIFLHHSVGENLIRQTDLRARLTAEGFSFWDQNYNFLGLTNPTGNPTGYHYQIPDDDTDPDGLVNLFSQKVYFFPINGLSGLLQHEVIILKSCFYPANKISSDSQLEELKSNYLEIRRVMETHKDHIFIVLTTPPLNPAETIPQEAARARKLATWLSSQDFLAGQTNIFVFDLFDLLAEPDASSEDYNMLRLEYRNGTDSHPNQTANEAIAPLLASFAVERIQQYRSSAGGN